MTLTEIPSTADAGAPHGAPTTIYVCVTCRRPGEPLDAPPGAQRPGAELASATVQAAENSGIAVRKLRCLANCSRGCSAAVRREGGWTYIFGNLDGPNAAPALLEGARLFSHASDGLMPWRGRPEALKRGLIARVPPIDFPGDTE